ncbi:MAG: ABC transporter ATP-binding protein, partial [Clostridium sp.]|nr:ABC transporter ATP-binding protein [Clostridium sp.]
MIKLKNIQKTYNKGKANAFQALYDVDLKIDDGELAAIIGKSGAGKSTLLHILACIDSYESGEYFIDNVLVKNLSEKKLAEIRNSKIGMVMQDYALVDDFSCIENVLLPLDFAKNKKANKTELAMNALRSVGMDGMAKKPVNKLSGGQKQRVAIARAVVNEPSIILADEPTGALDTKTSAEIMELFHKLNQNGRTVIIVTHDIEIAKQCDRIIEISDGKVINRGVKVVSKKESKEGEIMDMT